jgi:hypothetical protein
VGKGHGRFHNAFTIKVETSTDAKPGLLSFHLSQETCTENCSSDLHVLVPANEEN